MYFDHDAFMHHALHVLDIPVPAQFTRGHFPPENWSVIQNVVCDNCHEPNFYLNNAPLSSIPTSINKERISSTVRHSEGQGPGYCRYYRPTLLHSAQIVFAT